MYIVKIVGLPIMTERKAYKMHNILIEFLSKYCASAFLKCERFTVEMDFKEKNQSNIDYFEKWSQESMLYHSDNKFKHLTDEELESYWSLKLIHTCLVYFNSKNDAERLVLRVNTGYSRGKTNLRLDRIHILHANMQIISTPVVTETCSCLSYNNINNETKKNHINYFDLLPDECNNLIFNNLDCLELLNFSNTSKNFRKLISKLNIWKILNKELSMILIYLEKIKVNNGIFELTDKDEIKKITSGKFNYYDIDFINRNGKFDFILKQNVINSLISSINERHFTITDDSSYLKRVFYSFNNSKYLNYYCK